MEKSKLFADVHGPVPRAPKPAPTRNPPVVGVPPALSNILAKYATNKKAVWSIGSLVLFVSLTATFVFETPKSKVLLVKTPHSLTVAPATEGSENGGGLVGVTSSQTDAIASQAAEIANLKQQLALMTAQNQQISRAMEQAVAATSSTSVATQVPPPVRLTMPSLDQHGVLATVNNRVFQCAARHGVPVCIDIGYTLKPSQALPSDGSIRSLDQHGMLVTVNSRVYQCSARDGEPVCVGIRG